MKIPTIHQVYASELEQLRGARDEIAGILGVSVEELTARIEGRAPVTNEMLFAIRWLSRDEGPSGKQDEEEGER